MAWTHGNSNSTTGPSTSLDVTLAVTAGDLIVAFGSAATGQTTAFSDDVNGNYTPVASVESDRPSHQTVAAKIATTTTTVTITGAGGGGVDAIHVANFSHSGAIPGTADDVQTAPSAATVDLTTSVNDTLVVGFGDGSFSNDPGADYTAIAQTSVGSRVTSEYQTALTNSVGTITVDLVVGLARSIIGVAFNPPAPTTTTGIGRAR